MGHYDICKLIINKIRTTNPGTLTKTSSVLSPIYYAVNNGHHEIIHLFIDNGMGEKLNTILPKRKTEPKRGANCGCKIL